MLLLVIKNKYLINDLSAFLCMKRCKTLESLESFQKYISNHQGAAYPKHRRPYLDSILNSPRGAMSVGNCSGLTLVEQSGEQCSLFFVHSIQKNIVMVTFCSTNTIILFAALPWWNLYLKLTSSRKKEQILCVGFFLPFFLF